jgi:hypothetical protein
MPSEPVSAARRRRDDTSTALRRRIVSALRAGTLERGDRLPSVREIAAELEVDPRLVLSAYRVLAREGLVEIRPRSGIYVAIARGAVAGGPPAGVEGWIVDLLAQGVSREIPAPELGDWVRRCVGTVRLRAAVVATTDDQLDGMCRELRGDYGIEARGVRAAALPARGAPPAALRRADVLITTVAHAARVGRLARLLETPHIVVAIRPDLVGAEWNLLLRAPVYVVVADGHFVAIIRDFFAGVTGAENIRPVVLGRDDLAAIPTNAPVYVTRSARLRLGNGRVPGRVVPPARIFAPESAREVLAFVVRENMRALER